MCKPNFLTTTIFLVLSSAALQAQSFDFPDSTKPQVKEKVTKVCAACHQSAVVVQQRLSKAAWTKEVDKMTKWGAQVDPADRDAIIDYLSVNFSPDKPAPEFPRTDASP
jgi:mono/diheme cytochrome c family protein